MNKPWTFCSSQITSVSPWSAGSCSCCYFCLKALSFLTSSLSTPSFALLILCHPRGLPLGITSSGKAGLTPPACGSMLLAPRLLSPLLFIRPSPPKTEAPWELTEILFHWVFSPTKCLVNKTDISIQLSLLARISIPWLIRRRHFSGTQEMCHFHCSQSGLLTSQTYAQLTLTLSTSLTWPVISKPLSYLDPTFYRSLKR